MRLKKYLVVYISLCVIIILWATLPIHIIETRNSKDDKYTASVGVRRIGQFGLFNSWDVVEFLIINNNDKTIKMSKKYNEGAIDDIYELSYRNFRCIEWKSNVTVLLKDPWGHEVEWNEIMR